MVLNVPSQLRPGSPAVFVPLYRPLRCGLLSLGLCLLVAASAQAEAPSLAHLTPAGIQRGTTATIKCLGTFDWPIQVYCPGAKVTCSQEKGELQVSVPADLSTDRIWIRLYDSSGASAAVPLLVGNLPEALEAEPNDSLSDAQELRDFGGTPGGVEVTVNGVLEKNGDVDGYAVPLQAGQTLVAAVAANTHFGSPMDSILQVALPDGTVVAENHDAVGLDPRLAFTARHNGTYIVRIFAWPSAPNQSIRYHGSPNFIYRLSLTTGPYLAYAVDVVAPRRLPGAVRVGGWNLPEQALVEVLPLDPALPGLLPELESSALMDTTGSLMGLVRAPGMAGTARIRLVPATIQIMEASEAQASPQRIELNSALSACVGQPAGVDEYVVALKKDQQIEIVVESLSFHSPLVPLARLIDPQGQSVSESSNRGAAVEPKLTYKAPADGDYRLQVRDRFEAGGPSYIYRLSLSQPQAGFELKLAADAVVLSAEDALEIPITVVRRSGSGAAVGDIQVTAVGLPPGVTAAPVTSETTGETAKKVVLKLSSDGTPFSGPIRIQGVAGESECLAQTPVRFGASFEQVWLTVLAKPE